jgi:hypothetical protein
MALVLAGTTVTLVGGAVAQDPDGAFDPAHEVALPCEALSTPGLVPRSARNIVHLANVCGFVGTDVEFQSRALTNGEVHDYAFVGTMGGGLRIFDVTDPPHPALVGAYTDPGWENDIQVRENTAVIGVDPIGPATPKSSACLLSKSATAGGIDVIELSFNAATGTFQTSLVTCVPNLPAGGAHNATLHPSGDWLAMINPRSNGSVDVVDLRNGQFKHVYRIVEDASLGTSVCPTSGVTFVCISNGDAGRWGPHDLSFSADGNTMYVAAVNETAIVDVTNVLDGQAPAIKVIPNLNKPGTGLEDPENIDISHQADVSSDGKVLVITDERGGGLDNTDCNTDPNGVIGAAHFWALAPIDGVVETASASPTNPVKLGIWIYPNPTLAVDPLQPILATLPRTERGCTIHVFRLGGNGTAGPGEVAAGFGGVSSLPVRQTTFAHYGAGVWWVDFSSAPTAADGTVEDLRTTWGNARGWNVMPGADTWSAKEYKGFVYAGDIARGFDVYGFGLCDGVECVNLPVNTPGKASGGGQVEGELAELSILRGTAAGGRASFGFNASFSLGVLSGHLTFLDHGSRKDVKSTAIDSFTVAGNMATFTGRATVNGTPGVGFTVEVQDLGEPGAGSSANPDTFRIVLGDGYAAGGVLLKGNIQVHSA